MADQSKLLFMCPETNLEVVMMPNGHMAITDGYSTDYFTVRGKGEWVRESDQLVLSDSLKTFLGTLDGDSSASIREHGEKDRQEMRFDVVAERDWLRNALEHIAGSCSGRAAEIARAGLAGPAAGSAEAREVPGHSTAGALPDFSEIIRDAIDGVFSDVSKGLGLKSGDWAPDQEMALCKHIEGIDALMEQWLTANLPPTRLADAYRLLGNLAKKDQTTPRIVVFLRDSVIDEVISDKPIQAVLVDYAAKGEKVYAIPMGCGEIEDAAVWTTPVEQLPERVSELFEIATVLVDESSPSATPQSNGNTQPLAYLDVSTSHLSEETRFWLDEGSHGEPITVAPYEYGAFVSVPPFNEEGYEPPDLPEDLMTVLRYAAERGCVIVRFDADGYTYSDLPFYYDDGPAPAAGKGTRP